MALQVAVSFAAASRCLAATYASGGNDPMTVRQLESVLEQLKPQLQRAELNGKSAEDRNRVASSPQALLLSDQLDMNELDALRLLQQAEVESTSFGQEQLDTAAHLYFGERRTMLQLLYDLLLSEDARTLNEQVKSGLMRFAKALVNFRGGDGKTYAQTLLAVLDKIGKRMAQSPSPRVRAYYASERKLVAQCFFRIAYDHQLTPDEIISLQKVLAGANSVEDYHVTVILTLAMQASLDNTNQEDSTLDQADASLAANMGFLNNFVSGIQGQNNSGWADKSVCATVCLSGSLFFSNAVSKGYRIPNGHLVDQFFQLAVNNEAFSFISRMLAYQDFATEDMDLHFAQYINIELDVILTDMFDRHYNRIRDWKNRQDKLEADEIAKLNAGVPREHLHLRNRFTDLVGVVTRLCENEPNKAFDYLMQSMDAPKKHLFNFVLFAGDPKTLTGFIAFFNLLASFSKTQQGADLVFSLLNTKHSTMSQNMSWDNLFAQLRNSENILRQGSEQIQPDDLRIMEAFLNVVQHVAENSAAVRVRMVQHPQWKVINLFFGLICSRVSCVLKGALFNALASFAKTDPGANSIQSASICNDIWLLLESAQVLRTRPYPAGTTVVDSGIQYELHEVESSQQTYPETRAFLNLLDALIVGSGIPTNLGYGTRSPGIQPYLRFILDSVFLKATDRHYENRQELPQIQALCLRLFCRMLAQYEVPAVFSAASDEEHRRQPGFEILMAFLAGSAFTEKVFNIIDIDNDQGAAFLASDSGNVSQADCIQTSLDLLSLILERQQSLLDYANKRNMTRVPEQLEKLLTQRSKALMSIGILVNVYNRPFLALSALRLFSTLSQRPVFLSGKGNYLTRIVSTSPLNDQLIRALIERLDDDNQSYEPVRLAIIELFLDNLSGSSPNLTHALLEFDLKDIRKTEIPHPQEKYTCFHAVVKLITDGLGQPGGPNVVYEFPALAERCYELIFRLCEKADTSGPTMSYLRRHEQFFVKQFANLFPVGPKPTSLQDPNLDHVISTMFARTWQLRAVALELHVTYLKGLRQQSQQLLNIGFDTPAATTNEDYNSNGEDYDAMDVPEQSRMLVLELLNQLDFSTMVPMESDELASCGLDEAACTVLDSHGCPVLDVLLIKSKLPGQFTIQHDEFLRRLVVRNQASRLFHANVKLFETWRQFVVVTLTECFDLLTREAQEDVPQQLIQELLPKITGSKTNHAFIDSLTSVVLTLFTRLRQRRRYVDLVQNAAESSEQTLPLLPEEQLIAIVDAVASAISTSTTSSAGRLPLRGHLYTILLNYLRFIEPTTEDVRQRSLTAIVQKDANKVIDRIVRDALDGIDVLKTLALTMLDALVQLGSRASSTEILVPLMTSHVGNLIKSLHDAQLPRSYASSPEFANKLYVYEAKMRVLLRLAQLDPISLLNKGLLAELSRNPILQGSSDFSDHIDPVSTDPEVYQNMHAWLMPVLQLLLCLVAGKRNSSAVKSKVVEFLAHNVATFELLLQDRRAPTLTSLTTLQYISGIYYHTASFHAQAPASASVPTTKATKLILQLLAKYGQRRWLQNLKAITSADSELLTVPATLFVPVPGIYNPSALHQQAEAISVQICRNLISYCRAIDLAPPTELAKFKPLFAPSLALDEASEPTGAPSMTALSHLLSSTINALLAHQTLIERNINVTLAHLDELPPAEVDRLTGLAKEDFYPELGPAQRQQLAARALRIQLDEVHKQASTLLYILETTVYVIWRHTEFYLVHYASQPFRSGPSASFKPEGLTANAQRAILDPLGQLAGLNLHQLVPSNKPGASDFLDLITGKLSHLILRLQGNL